MAALPRDAGFASDFIEHGAAQPPVNAHIPNVCCAFPINLRLALEPDLRF